MQIDKDREGLSDYRLGKSAGNLKAAKFLNRIKEFIDENHKKK